MSAFTSLVSVPVGIVSSVAGIKICAITAGIKAIKRNQLSRKRRESMIM